MNLRLLAMRHQYALLMLDPERYSRMVSSGPQGTWRQRLASWLTVALAAEQASQRHKEGQR